MRGGLSAAARLLPSCPSAFGECSPCCSASVPCSAAIVLPATVRSMRSLKVGFLLPTDKLSHRPSPCWSCRARYQYVGFCRPLKAQRAVCAFCIESDAHKVVRVVGHNETLVGVLPSPLVVGTPGDEAHFVLPLLAFTVTCRPDP